MYAIRSYYGTFEQQIAHQAVVTVGEIPAGLGPVRIELQSGADVDIQIIDEATGDEAVHLLQIWIQPDRKGVTPRITSYNVCYTKLLRLSPVSRLPSPFPSPFPVLRQTIPAHRESAPPRCTSKVSQVARGR